MAKLTAILLTIVVTHGIVFGVTLDGNRQQLEIIRLSIMDDTYNIRDKKYLCPLVVGRIIRKNDTIINITVTSLIKYFAELKFSKLAKELEYFDAYPNAKKLDIKLQIETYKAIQKLSNFNVSLASEVCTDKFDDRTLKGEAKITVEEFFKTLDKYLK